MPVFVVKPDSLDLHAVYERSPFVTLVTDGTSSDGIPSAVRSAADNVVTGDQSPFPWGKVPKGSQGVIVWLKGDRLIHGSAPGIRRDLFNPGRRAFAPVHFTYALGLDLISLQPRSFAVGTQTDSINHGFRIAGNPPLSPVALLALQTSAEPWALFTLALLEEQKKPGSQVDTLTKMYRECGFHPTLASLALRNLIVALIREDKVEKAWDLLEEGTEKYPGYSELPYLAALLRVGQERASQAIDHLKKATEQFDPNYVGSGGEASYRAHWLMGTVAELVGNQPMALSHYLTGVVTQPAFEPSVVGVLRQRIPTDAAYQVQWSLASLARREPKYLEPVFYFLLLHRQLDAARRLLSLATLSEESRLRLREQLESVAAAYCPGPAAKPSKPGIILTGPFWVNSSLARINREIAAAIMQTPDLEAGLEPHGFASVPGQTQSHFDAVSRGLMRRVPHLDLTIRQHWPPEFHPAPRGKLATIVHWEFGSVPQKWVEQIERNVDELWVASNFVRDVFIRSGVRPEKVFVIPPGIDTSVFALEGKAWRPEGCREFVFLFVGGAIARKGIDLLARAYRLAFTHSDDVSLIIKDIGSSSFYSHNSLLPELQKSFDSADTPHVIVLTDELHDSSLAALYRGSNCLVLPYRGEGFGMPLAEAMACGKPVITTALGPAPEFCTPESGYFVPAEVAEVPQPHPPLGPMAGQFTWFEPDAEELAKTLRHVYEHPDEAAGRGKVAAQRIRSSHNWQRIHGMYLERIRCLVGH